MKKLSRFIILMISLLLMSGYTDICKVKAEELEEEVPEGYTEIRTAAELSGIRNNPEGNYILMEDIDLSELTQEGGDYDDGRGWNSIENFSGTLDGNGHRIIGMHIFGEFEGKCIGLFEQLNSATVKNLGMVDCDIQVKITGYYYAYVGGIAGDVVNSVIENCYCSGKIEEQGNDYFYYVGGLAGYVSNSTIENCFNLSSVMVYDDGGSNSLFIGGIVGYINDDGMIKQSYNRGTVSAEVKYGNKYVGSIAGYNRYGAAFLCNCYYLRDSAEKAMGNYTDNDNTVLLSDAQMKMQNLFSGFDFDNVWEIDAYCSYLYPQLKKNRRIRVESLNIEKEPEKLTYNQGDKLEFGDGKISVTYEDEATAELPLKLDMLSGYDMMEIGTQTVTVTYGGQQTSFEIEVKEIPVDSVTLPEKITIYRPAEQQLQAEILPKNATNKELTWESTDSKIARVDENGKVKGINPGTATVTATSANGKTASCEVTVAVKVTEIQLNVNELRLNEGKTAAITATRLPLNGTEPVNWKTSDEYIAEVNENGVVTANHEGKAVITAYTESGVKANCKVTVVNPSAQPGSSGNQTVTQPGTQTVNSGDQKAKTIKKVKSTKAKIKSVKNKKKKTLQVKVSGLAKCDGYQIQYATKSNFKSAKTIKKKSGTITIKKLKKGKKYYLRVRVYKKISGKLYYGKWSSKKSVKIKK